MAELKPPETAVVMVPVDLAPCAIVIDVGAAVKVNAGTAMSSEMLAVWVTPPPTPVMVTI